jgi:DNA polymerase elongation subunit (family B)
MRTDDNSVFTSLQQVAGVRINRANHNRDIIDTYVLRKAREKGIRLPTGGPPAEYKYLGAYVFPSVAGMSENVVYCDISSMYPNLVVTLNLSPETVIGTEDDLRESQYTVEDTVCGYIDPRPVKHLESGEDWQQYKGQEYKMIYDPDASSVKWTCDDGDGPQYEKLYVVDHQTERGFLTDCVDELIELKNKYRGQNLYGAIKRVCNSIYGVTGYASDSSSFRLYDWRIAEAITLSGRKMIQKTADYIVSHAQDNGFEDAYVVMGDTDGFGVSYVGASTQHEALTTAAEAVANLNEYVYDEMMADLFGVDPENHNAAIDVEAYSPRVFVPSENPPHGDKGVSKRYIKWTKWEN